MAVMARFHQYSFRNCLLIAQQRPTATQVLGFHSWKKVGRTVKKGAKGIGITAPLAYRKETDSGDEKEIRGFRVVHVFDIEQTEGDELPTLSQPVGDAAKWIVPTETLVRSKGIELLYSDLPEGTYGYSAKGKIAIQNGLSPARALSTLIHELAHEVLHPDTESRKSNSHIVKETEAEAVSHIVCQAIGIVSLEHSTDYIHLHDGDCEVLAKSMQRIQKCATSILKDLLDREAKVSSIETNTNMPSTVTALAATA